MKESRYAELLELSGTGKYLLETMELVALVLVLERRTSSLEKTEQFSSEEMFQVLTEWRVYVETLLVTWLLET